MASTTEEEEKVPRNLAIPMKLDAFIFNRSVCTAKDKEARIAPINQHNYTFLRMEDHMAQSDLLPHADLHYSARPETNPRFTDLGRQTTRTNRLGVYLHWVLPRAFRSGTAGTPTEDKRQPEAMAKGISDKVEDPTAPVFPQVPNRWLVVRRLDPDTTEPKGAPIAPVQAWIVESDRMFTIDKLGPEVDLQVDVAPFITSYLAEGQDPSKVETKKQAEVFIGVRTPVDRWKGEDALKTEQRVGLSVASSSNQLFPDYQYHCGNVFSMLDTFSYVEGKETKTLTASKTDKDLLNISEGTTRGDRLRSLQMELNKQEKVPAAVEKWLHDQTSAQSICHGAMYDVEWNADARPPKIPANDCAERLHERMPVAVGTTAIDTLIAYAASHQSPDTFEEDLYKLRVLLRAADDSLDAHERAADELTSEDFMHVDGGTQFTHADQSAKEPAKPPSADTQKAFRELNAAQRLLDSLGRRRQQLRWDMFAIWWRYISDNDNKNEHRRAEYIVAVKDARLSLRKIDTVIGRLGKEVNRRKKLVTKDPEGPKAGTMQEFSVRRDPTMLVAGVSAGWPTDFQKGLKVRLDTQLATAGGKVPDDSFPGLRHVPEDLRPSASGLLQEFDALSDPTRKKPDAKDGVFFPVYHDGKYADKDPSDENPWRDRWNKTQPWFPLYMEWEGQYTHIPKGKWDMVEQPTEHQSLCGGRTQYGLIADVTKGYNGPKADVRVVSGRSLILPQASFTLEAHIDRILSTIPKDVLKKYLSEERQALLKENLTKFAFLSAPLQGLTDHLLTLANGSHVKPLIRVPGQKPVPLADAQKAAEEIEIDIDDLGLIDDASDPTPYGPNMTLLGKQQSGFKPATHGQFRFTKLNIMDKFGQAISAIDPVSAGSGHAPLYPCISEFFAPQALPADGLPNIVDRSRSSSKKGECEFLQLPMGINQPARLNASFLSASHGDRNQGEAYWRPAADWEEESPVWGWVMVNYVDRSLQLFLPDGSFYSEVRVTEGSSSSSSEAKWRPFPPSPRKGATKYMDQLLHLLVSKDQQYLLEFISMIDEAVKSLTAPPSAYGQFLNALTGRPLALVNMGWSLELAEKPKTNQSTLDSQRNVVTPEPSLIRTKDNTPYYKFPLKLGNRSRMTDGLVCYFSARSDLPDETDPSAPDLDLSHFYTYTPCPQPPKTASTTKRYAQPISPQTFPKLTPFWHDPEVYVDAVSREDFETYETARNREIVPFGALIDPFLPVHGYTGILPTGALKLPTWTWESALKRMVTFFHVGPVVVVGDVPPPPEPDGENGKEGEYALQISSLPVAEWAWLQPFSEKEKGKEEPQFVELALGKGEARPGFEKGPYTAVEGYLVMKAPIERKEPGQTG
ncbi:hypothetical protein B0H66DRAFT_629115 [Apodospora peruviana]|uniref:Uncharacterized protein n=1 Tax=Apodospora peruviana TaxID=516989 RepID=A0AAE0LZI5_9PEZI|nr:hypothetical protein B0H66DRAFT_629115 [Apodospora peruviana]